MQCRASLLSSETRTIAHCSPRIPSQTNSAVSHSKNCVGGSDPDPYGGHSLTYWGSQYESGLGTRVPDSLGGGVRLVEPLDALQVAHMGFLEYQAVIAIQI